SNQRRRTACSAPMLVHGASLLRPVEASPDMRHASASGEVPESNTGSGRSCGIFATLGEYFRAATLTVGFSARMSPTRNMAGASDDHRYVSVDSDSDLRSRRRIESDGRSAKALEREDSSSDRHPTLAFWWSMIFFRKPVPTRIKSGAGFFGIMLWVTLADADVWRAGSGAPDARRCRDPAG